MTGIYALLVGDVVYVGATQNLKRREQAHFYELRNGIHPNKTLQAEFALNEIVKFEVLEDGVLTEQLADRERYWADKLSSVDAGNRYAHKDGKNPMPLRWKLKELLVQLEINPHQLAKQIGTPPPSIYRLLRDEGPENFNRTTLHNILSGLEKLTGQTFEIGDLIEYERN